jgi:hypothetical protein
MKTASLAVAFFVVFCTSVFADDRFLFEQNFAVNNITEVFVDEVYWTYSYAPNIGFTLGKRVIYHGTIQLLDYVIPASALAVLNKDELRLLRNTIYAKHGMILQSSDLTAHFRQFNWYNPRSSNVEGRLGDIDRRNIANIQLFENAQPDHSLGSTIVGSWSYPPPMPDWVPEIRINNDNTIEWYTELTDGGDRFKGSYRIENGFLVVFVTEQSVGTPDFLTNSSWRWPSGVSYRDGLVTYNEPIRMVFPVGDINIWQYPYHYFDFNLFFLERQIGLVVLNKGLNADELINDLDLSMQMRAIELSRARHNNSNFEEISLTDSDIEVAGPYIYMVNTYRVIMRGAILGIVRNIVDVTVRGQIDGRNNSMQILRADIR